MRKLIFLIPVIFLILATTLTKNSTKQLDKKIFETKENIRALENRLELVLLDYNFLTSPKKLMEYQTKFFENNLIQNWWDPQLSGSSFGFLPDYTWMIPNTELTNQLYGSNVSMEISYGWNLSSNESLIRTYLSGGEPRNIIFDNSFKFSIF